MYTLSPPSVPGKSTLVQYIKSSYCTDKGGRVEMGAEVMAEYARKPFCCLVSPIEAYCCQNSPLKETFQRAKTLNLNYR